MPDADAAFDSGGHAAAHRHPRFAHPLAAGAGPPPRSLLPWAPRCCLGGATRGLVAPFPFTPGVQSSREGAQGTNTIFIFFCCSISQHHHTEGDSVTGNPAACAPRLCVAPLRTNPAGTSQGLILRTAPSSGARLAAPLPPRDAPSPWRAQPFSPRAGNVAGLCRQRVPAKRARERSQRFQRPELAAGLRLLSLLPTPCAGSSDLSANVCG